jgi:hypothetical protein
MLTCVFHPINKFQVVEDDEAERLLASGVWFDSPDKANRYREEVEDEIKSESDISNSKQKHKGK